ncbi:MAG: sigma-70 domain-containing protein [Ruminococcus sp.]|jgi:RNA polymerase primary sigma factor
MDKKTFQQKLHQFIIEKSGSLSEVSEIKEFFKDENLTEEQAAMILAYVEEKQEEDSLTPDEQDYLKNYLASLDSMEEGKERYWLRFTALEAVKYHSAGMALEDLIQEGNLGLALGLQAAADLPDPERVIEEHIRRALSQASDFSAALQTADRRMVEKVRALDESLTKLEKELGRKVYPEEIAADMGISEEEVRSIIKLTGEDAGEEGGTEDAGTEGN